MSDQEQIKLLKEYIAYLEARLLHSDKLHDHAMKMVRELMEKMK